MFDLSRCDMCINSRHIISENGIHPICCCLSAKKSLECSTGKKDHYIKRPASRVNNVDEAESEAEDTTFANGIPYDEIPQGDLKSCEALKAYAREVLCGNNPTNSLLIRMFDETIDNAPSQWIPITFREANDEEYKDYIERHDYIPREECTVYDCRMPDDGQEVLVTTCGGEVCEDIFCADPDYYGFENCSDPDDVIAWMPKPEPYKKEGKEE